MNSALLVALASEIAEQPDSMRLGQLISNAARTGGWENEDLFYCPDETILKGLDLMYSNRLKKGVAFVVTGWHKSLSGMTRVNLTANLSETVTDLFNRANILCNKGEANINGIMLFKEEDYEKPLAQVEVFRHDHSKVFYLTSISSPSN